jgi:hypothetical protein
VQVEPLIILLPIILLWMILRNPPLRARGRKSAVTKAIWTLRHWAGVPPSLSDLERMGIHDWNARRSWGAWALLPEVLLERD